MRVSTAPMTFLFSSYRMVAFFMTLIERFSLLVMRHFFALTLPLTNRPHHFSARPWPNISHPVQSSMRQDCPISSSALYPVRRSAAGLTAITPPPGSTTMTPSCRVSTMVFQYFEISKQALLKLTLTKGLTFVNIMHPFPYCKPALENRSSRGYFFQTLTARPNNLI